MHKKTINPCELYPLAIAVLKEMITELTEELKNENFNDLKLIQCLFHNISVQAKYVEGIAKDIESLEDGDINEMIKNSKSSISDTPSYC